MKISRIAATDETHVFTRVHVDVIEPEFPFPIRRGVVGDSTRKNVAVDDAKTASEIRAKTVPGDARLQPLEDA